MKKSIKVDQKRRGRPPTGRAILVSSRFPDPIVAAVEAWAADRQTTRSDAMFELWLTVKTPARPVSQAGPRLLRSQEVATKAVAMILASAAPPEVRDQRPRRL